MPSPMDPMQPTPNIDVRQFLIIALAGNSYLHSSIDACYQKNEWAYYEAYQQSIYNGSPLFAMYSTRSEEKIRKVAGILEWCYQNSQFSPLDQLIKKGYKFVYQYLQQHPYIDFEHFIRTFAKRQKGKIVKEIDLYYQNIVLWYLCVRENKPIDTERVAWQSFQTLLHSALAETHLEEANFSSQNFEDYRVEINELYEEYNISKNPSFDSLEAFLEYLIAANLKKIYDSNPFCDAEMAQQQVFQESPVKYIGALGGWLKALKIHEQDAAEHVPFTKNDLDMVFLELLYAKKNNRMTIEEQSLFIIGIIYIKCLSYLYKETKQLYLDQSKQDYYLEMMAKESRILDQEENLSRKQSEWQRTSKQQQNEISGVTEELRQAQAKIRQLEKQIENMEDYTKEVHALRNYVYREEQSDGLEEKTPELETILAFIQGKKMMVFGGHPNWQKKLKELLPSVEFLDADEKNRDISKTQRADAVFINISVFTHAFYKKIMKELSKSEVPLIFLSGQNNIEKTVLEIYHWLKG